MKQTVLNCAAGVCQLTSPTSVEPASNSFSAVKRHKKVIQVFPAVFRKLFTCSLISRSNFAPCPGSSSVSGQVASSSSANLSSSSVYSGSGNLCHDFVIPAFRASYSVPYWLFRRRISFRTRCRSSGRRLPRICQPCPAAQEYP